jgi:FkbM family methyltransferase
MPVHFTDDDRGRVVVVDGIRLRYAEEHLDHLRYHVLLNGESIDELGSFLELARSSSVLFDVGSANGLFSHLFCLLNERNRAVAFEPSPGLTASAARWARLNGTERQVVTRECAVGRVPTQAAARIDPTGLVSVNPPVAGGDEISVEVTTLDREIARLDIVPDVIKIDVEGYEWDVLCGAKELLKEHKPSICLELHLDLLERRGVAPRTLVDELSGYGYTFRDCVGAALAPSRIYDSPNALLRFVCVGPSSAGSLLGLQ